MLITILGSSGFIGSNFNKILKKKYKIIKLDLRKFDYLLNEKKLIEFLFYNLNKSDYVINCCASLKPKTKADFYINSKLPKIIQKTFNKMKKKPYLIHISTLNVLIKDRTDKYSISKKVGEISLNKKNTTIIRLPLITSNKEISGNLKIFQKYLDLNLLPIYPMIYPGHIYRPVDINDLSSFLVNLLKIKNKNYEYNLIGKKQMSLWDIYLKIAKSKKKRVIKLNTNFLSFLMNDKLKKKSFIRNNDFLSQLFSIDQSKFKNIKLTII